MTAAGTSGYGDELAGYGDLRALGAVVVKSLAAFAWEGNPAPRVAAVGRAHAQRRRSRRSGRGGVARTSTCRTLAQRGCDVVASIWGRTVAEFASAAEAMRGADVVAMEVNASCPNLESRSIDLRALGARDRRDRSRRPRWPVCRCGSNSAPTRRTWSQIADAALDAGADALVLVNTVLGMAIDVETRASDTRQRRRWRQWAGDLAGRAALRLRVSRGVPRHADRGRRAA